MVDCVRLMSSQVSIVMIVQARQSNPGLFKLSQKSKSSTSISWIPVSQYNNPTSQLPPVQTSIILGLVCVQGTINRGDLLPNAETPPEGKTEPGYGITKQRGPNIILPSWQRAFLAGLFFVLCISCSPLLAQLCNPPSSHSTVFVPNRNRVARNARS